MPDKARQGFFAKLFGGADEPVVPHAVIGPDQAVTPDARRCVQCGVCGYNCPVGIPVRDFAHRGLQVNDPRCVQCGQCVEVCPRGTLRWSKRQSASQALLLELDQALQSDVRNGAQPTEAGRP